MVIRFILTVALMVSIAQSDNGIPAQKRTQRLLKAINSGNANAKISLVPTENFEETPGKVIFVSYEEGLSRLMELARAGKPELFMLFLPKWNAWITVSLERDFTVVNLDNTYLIAAISAGLESYFCHTHNDMRFVPNYWSEEEYYKELLTWIMPSATDLEQLYKHFRKHPNTKILGIIANTQGITEYWYDKNKISLAYDDSQDPMVEGYTLNYLARSSTLPQMPSVLADYKGYISLKFNPVP